MRKRPRLVLVKNCGKDWRMDLVPRAPLEEQRPKVVVQKLDAVHRRVGDVSGGEPLQPVVFDLALGSGGHAAKADVPPSRRFKKIVGLVKERHGGILGNTFPSCQGTLSPSDGKAFPMGQKFLSPRHAVAKNLKALAKKEGLSGHEIARRAKVDPKTVNNQMNAKYDPQPEQVDAVARVFGLNYWDMLNPDLNPDVSRHKAIRQLIALFGKTDDKGRDSIMNVAEMAAGARPADAAEQQTEPAQASK